jgi:hypothetical protein
VSSTLQLSTRVSPPMAVMCERVTLPPISSLDFGYSAENAPSRYGHERKRSQFGPVTPRSPSPLYARSSWDANRPQTSGRPFPQATTYRQDVRCVHFQWLLPFGMQMRTLQRPRLGSYDASAAGANVTQPSRSVAYQPTQPSDDRRHIHSPPMNAVGISGLSDQYVFVSW